MSPSFLEIPDIPMEMIMNNLDYLAIQSVRKTCWVLRNFIDDKKPGISMKEIRISQKSDTAVGLAINLPTSGPGDDTYINLTYEKHENGCRIKGGTSDGDKNKIVENVNFLDAILHDLKVALNTQKSTFEEIDVCGASFFEKFEEIMKSQKPFGAEFIVIHDNSLEHARQILKHADPKYLKQIVITSHDPCYIRECVWFESSKSSKTFSHFATTSIQLENLEVETIRAIKENFLQFHEYSKYLQVEYLEMNRDVRKHLFIDAFGEAFKPLGEHDEIWFFNVPGNKEKILKVLNKWTYFEFRFAKKREIPEGYVILD